MILAFYDFIFVFFVNKSTTYFVKLLTKTSICTVLVLECNYSNKQEDIMKHTK
ncbi:peptidoglycan-binding protein, partial [Listeria monocytogenes]|nr:peptidoglycan-binding protein [Listeria monocytogenes]